MKTETTDPQLEKDPWGISYATGYFHLGMYHKAWTELDNLSSSEQDDPEVLTLRGRILLAEKKWDDTIQFCQDARKKHPWVSDFYIQEALAFDKIDEHDKARTTWLAAPREIRATAFYHYNLARCETMLGHFALARQHVKTALSLSPAMTAIIVRDRRLSPFSCDPELN